MTGTESLILLAAPCLFKTTSRASHPITSVRRKRGLGIYIAPGTFNGQITNGAICSVLANAVTYFWLTNEGQIGSALSMPDSVYPIGWNFKHR
jgi:hypothetical protein